MHFKIVQENTYVQSLTVFFYVFDTIMIKRLSENCQMVPSLLAYYKFDLQDF